jgi:formate dehydrogenase alpha subunit
VEVLELETITITLNGREVSGNPGMTILELAQESNVKIPTLCYDPCLTSIGACRICIVEDERSGTLSAACVTPIAAGMAINTDSPRVREHRRTIVKLMLASHPDSCLVCDKGNRCELRRLASEMGVGELELQRIPQSASIREVNPFIERDLSKCILCAKCIRADHELVVQGAIDYIHRGFAAKPATLDDAPLEASECTFCGTCVAICPTGALMEKHWSHRVTATASVATICPLCGCGCSIDLETRNGQIVRAIPGTDNGVNHGTLCVKGSYGYDFVHSPDRLTSPLINMNGEFQPATWDQALALVASEIERVKRDHGPNSMAYLGSSKCTNEENYLLQRFARCVTGTNNIDNGSRMYSAASICGLGAVAGFPGTTSLLDSLERSEVILNIGANLSSSAPIVDYAVRRAVKYRGAKLLLIDPQQTRLSPFADIWLRPEIGTDLALINGLAHVIISEGLLDEEFVTRKTENFDAYREKIAECTPQHVEQVTGVPREAVTSAARLFANADLASIIYGNGIAQSAGGTNSVMALANLAMLTGNIGHRSGILALHRDCNGQGACDMGALPDWLPGYVPVEDDKARQKFAACWGADLPGGIGLSAVDMVSGALEGKVKGMYIMGENPVLSFPQQRLVEEALGSLEFLVVQDLFLTETARLAKVVLPSSSFAEKEGTFTNFEGRGQRLRKVIAPYGNSLPDWEIILKLADTMGRSMPFSSIQQIMAEIEEMVPLYSGIGDKGPDTVNIYRLELDRNSLINRRLYKGKFPSGFGCFSPVRYEAATNGSKKGYPLALLVGSVLYHSGNGSRTSRSPRLSKFLHQPYVEIGETDAERFKIDQGDEVRVISPWGDVTAVARFSDRFPEGVIFIPNSLPTAPVNRLFEIALDAQSGAPALKTCAVKLERISHHEQASG